MEKPTSLFDRFNNWVRNSVTLKLVAIGILTLLLLIPSSMIQSLVDERQSLRNDATIEVSSKWGGSQTLGGPVISIPYYSYVRNEKGETTQVINYAHFLPDSFFMSGQLKPEKRYRGIYVVVLYNSKMNISGSFDKLNYEALPIEKSSLRLKDAVISFGIPDMKGIRQNIAMDVNGKKYNFNPGLPKDGLFNSGISFPIDLSSNEPLRFNFALDLNGSSDINFLPFGKETVVDLKGSWSDPSFDGAFLPDERTITGNQFTAKWKVLHLNRNYPQQGVNNFIDDNGHFGIKLMLPVDEYQKTTRSAKYCIMFIILTFTTFFFIEIINRRRIHAVQYLLVGFAVTLFYILLLSMSEYISFNLSYLIASLLILITVTLYAKAIFKSNFLAGLTCMVLAILYGFFYSLLQLHDYSLLLGSFGLLFILAFIMYLTRKIDWYSLNERDNHP